VAADEKVGRVLHQLLPDADVVPSGIASDMCHHNVGIFALPSEYFWEAAAQFATVYVACYGTDGTNLFQLGDDVHGADVSGMPNLVTC
jgi:hypothetical protein